eukprot:1056114-Pleurochrysis_carterae.AAC.3
MPQRKQTKLLVRRQFKRAIVLPDSCDNAQQDKFEHARVHAAVKLSACPSFATARFCMLCTLSLSWRDGIHWNMEDAQVVVRALERTCANHAPRANTYRDGCGILAAGHTCMHACLLFRSDNAGS